VFGGGGQVRRPGKRDKENDKNIRWGSIRWTGCQVRRKVTTTQKKKSGGRDTVCMPHQGGTKKTESLGGNAMTRE